MTTKKTDKQYFEVGIAVKDIANIPILMTATYFTKTFEEASQEFLNDPTVKKHRINDVVMLPRVGDF